MKVPFSWLKEFVDIDCTPEELQEKLFSCGFEVEELIQLDKDIDRVVVGIITECCKQEGTDHLNLCKLDCGAYGKDIEITTGASNIFAGAHVPVALDNSTLPGGFKIKARKMHGVMSNGMLCSGEELGINDDWYDGAEVHGILILSEDTVPGTPIAQVVGLDDYIFDISITANRPDCQSVLGMAREVAAILHQPLKMPALDYTPDEVTTDLKVSVAAYDLCPRYLAHYVHDVKIAKSPQWMRRKLALSGIRGINNLVDITNYVMTEMGQPMHAFDFRTIDNHEIIVRRAAEGEKIITLDEKEFTLNSNNLLITDAAGPVALAGVMGGLNSEVEADSTEILFESAKFARDSIRKTARSLGQVTDASSHYEKGISEYTTELALERALHLVEELGCGKVGATHADCADPSVDRSPRIMTASVQKINDVLGIQVPGETMVSIFRDLAFEAALEGDTLTLTVPRYREDIEDYPDLAEEVIREYGYDHIVPTFLNDCVVTSGGLNYDQKQRLKMKRALAGMGFYETSTMAFYGPQDLDKLHFPADAPERQAIPLVNPLADYLSVMRTTMAPSMFHVIVENLKRGNAAGRLFEISNVYHAKSLPLTELPEEKLVLSLGMFGDTEDFFTMKGAIEGIARHFDLKFSYIRKEVPYLHPGITAAILCGGEEVGFFGKLSNEIVSELDIAKGERKNQKIFLAEIDYPALMSHVEKNFKYQPLPAYPTVKRDLAFVVQEEITCGEIEGLIYDTCHSASNVELFDVFRGEKLGAGLKSMAFSVTFSNREKELSGEQVDGFVRKILKKLKNELGAELR